MKDFTILGCILGSSYFGKLPDKAVQHNPSRSIGSGSGIEDVRVTLRPKPSALNTEI